MSLTINVSCSNHQIDDGGYGREAEISIDALDEHTAMRVKEELEADDWIVQFNGDNMDTYCSKKCAE